MLEEDFSCIPKGVVVVPEYRIGTGLARLNRTAPKTFEYLQKKLGEFEGKDV